MDVLSVNVKSIRGNRVNLRTPLLVKLYSHKGRSSLLGDPAFRALPKEVGATVSTGFLFAGSFHALKVANTWEREEERNEEITRNDCLELNRLLKI